MKYPLFVFCLLLSFSHWRCFSQNKSEISDSVVVGNTEVDSLYREDQFYIGFGFNLLLNKPKKISQSGFSGGLHLGFIRDMPINKQRNISLGAGLGWSVNSYGQNLLISENMDDQSVFKALDRKDGYSSNHFTTYLLEAPLQFRWRTSTPTSYKFWRIYAGFRFGYIYYFHSKYQAPDIKIIQTKVEELNRFRYGATFTFGYNTFNFHVYYSLNQFFDGTLENTGTPIGLNTLKIGLMFYIL